VGVSATEKNRRIAIDEELLITGVSISGENQRVLNWWCFSNKKRRNN
jgi:hypothetical protein